MRILEHGQLVNIGSQVGSIRNTVYDSPENANTEEVLAYREEFNDFRYEVYDALI